MKDIRVIRFSIRGIHYLEDLDTSYPKMLKKSIIPRCSDDDKKGGLILATHLSAIKRARQNEKRRLRNLNLKSTVRSSVKKVRTAVEKKDVEGAQKALLSAVSLIQKAHTKGVFHGNTSARKISRLTREVNTLKTPPT